MTQPLIHKVRGWRGMTQQALRYDREPTSICDYSNKNFNKHRLGTACIRATQPVIVYKSTDSEDQLKTLHVPINHNQAIIKGKINDVDVLILLDTGTRGEYILQNS